jgi:NAD(P)-dependent dehydrogenase (short-subunit alcohol dehydrogenase family)
MSAKKSKIAVITGATDGMGRVVAPQLARAGYFVVVHGRNERRGKAVVDEITRAGGEVRFMASNLASIEDVQRFAANLNAEFDHIDVLINNAGIGTGPEGAPREVSADGLELRFAVNYLAGFLLTRLVLEKVKAASAARIVNVASAGQGRSISPTCSLSTTIPDTSPIAVARSPLSCLRSIWPKRSSTQG